MKIKVKDVAALAKVSATTASLVLNQKPCRVSEETKERIFRIYEELRYQQENYGIFQGFKKVNCIGLIVPEHENPFFLSLAEQIVERAEEKGYTVFLCYAGKTFESLKNIIECFIGKNMDGVLLIPPETIDKEGIRLIKSLQTSGMPLVLVDRAVYSVFCDFVTSDNKYGGKCATEYLIACGHEKIGIIMGGGSTYTADKRLEGYKEALAKHKIVWEERYIYRGIYAPESGYAGAEALRKQGVTAIFATNDLIAKGIYQYAEESGLQIGKDLSVVGYDDTKLCEFLEPPLASMEQNIFSMAETAVDLMLKQIKEEEHPTPAQNFYYTPILHKRASVGKQEFR